LQNDERLGMVFLFPGLDIFLRINGRGRVSTAPELLHALREGDRIPKTATIVRIDQVLVHCGKAINRAGLWKESGRIDRQAVPSVGRMLAELAKMADAASVMDEAQIEHVNAHYDEAITKNLYG
jgi:hypothetical protein